MKKTYIFQKLIIYRKDHPFIFYFLVAYLGGILIYILIFHLWFADYSNPMSLNEFGDFLAGVFAPIAFLFLYLGYKQNSESLKIQSEELRASTEALTLQVSEMKESVEQQKILSQLQKVELEEKHISVTPVFSISCALEVTPQTSNTGEIYKTHVLKFTIENSSDNDARKLTITIEHSYERKFEIIPKSSPRVLTVLFTEDEINKFNSQENFERGINIEFENIFGRCYSSLFLIKYVFISGKHRTFVDNLGTILKVNNTQPH